MATNSNMTDGVVLHLMEYFYVQISPILPVYILYCTLIKLSVILGAYISFMYCPFNYIVNISLGTSFTLREDSDNTND